MTTTATARPYKSTVVRPKIRALLDAEPHRVAEFADYTGWTEDLVRAWVRNQAPISVDDVLSWAAVLDVPATYLTGQVDEPLGVAIRLGKYSQP